MSDESKNPAFPCLDSSGPSGLSLRYPGLTKRELFAAMFIPAIIEKLNFTGLLRKEMPGDYDEMAKVAVEVADALIKALEADNG